MSKQLKFTSLVKNNTSLIHKYFRQGIAEEVALTSSFLQSKLAEYEAHRAEIDAMQTKLLNGNLPLAYEGGEKP